MTTNAVPPNDPAVEAQPAKTRTPASSEARIRAWLLGLLFVLGPPALLFLYYRAMFVGLVNPDAMDFAQIGRNLRSGEGFTTDVLRPLALAGGPALPAQPEVNHGPLFPLMLAIAFAAAGAKDTICALVSGIFYLLTIPVVYLLGKRIFGRRVGIVTALIFTVNALTLEYATSGLHVTLCIFLATLLFYALYGVAAAAARHERGAHSAGVPTGAIVATGALAALLYLAEPAFVWAIPVIKVAVWAFVRPYRARGMLLFAVPLVLLSAPWMVRNYRVAGDPVFAMRGKELWMYTRSAYPGLSAYRRSPEEFVATPALPKEIVRKVLVGAAAVLDNWPQVAANWALAFFLPSLLFRFNDKAATQLRRYLLWSLGAVFAGLLLFQVQMPLFVAFVPAMLAYAVAYLLFIAQQAQLARTGAVVLALSLGAALVYPVAIQVGLRGAPQIPGGKVTAQTLAAAGSPKDVVLTNQPWLVAWYANKRALLLPAADTSVSVMRKRYPDTRWLVLTPEVNTWSQTWEVVYTVLERWTAQWMLAGRQPNAKRPGLIQFRGPEPPLMGGLAGFVSVPPLEAAAPNTRPTVVAALPPPASQRAPGGTGR